MKCTDAVRNCNRLEQDRKNLDGVLELIKRYVMPLRSEFYKRNNTENEVDWRSRQDYDSTAAESVDTLSASMQSALTSMAMRWFELKFNVDELNKAHEVQIWLENTANKMYEALQESNFDIEASEFYIDLCGYGSSLITLEGNDDPETYDGLNFKASPIDASYFEEDAKGKIVNYYKNYGWTPLQILEKFGEVHTPQAIKDKVSKTDEKIQVLFCVYKRKGIHTDLGKRVSADKRPYGYKYILKHNSEMIGEEGGYYEMPAFISRWRRAPGSVWGYGPSHIALSDILTLNELTGDLLESLGKAIDPTTLTTQRNLMSDLDLGRGGLTIVRDINNIAPFETRARFDVGELKIDRLQESIQRTYRVDQLQLKDSPAMTATEAEIRYEIMQRLLGPTLGRLKNDFLDPTLERVFNMMYRAGRIDPIPEIVAQMEGELNIEYTGPLPRAQRTQQNQAVQQWVAGLAQIAEIRPEVMDIPDFDAIARGTGKLLSVPAIYMKDEKVVKQDRKGREAAAGQQGQAEQLGGLASAAKDGAAAMKAVSEIQ